MSVDSQSNDFVTSLYSQFGRPVLKLILKRNGGDMSVAETVLQDTFIAVHKSFHTFHHKSTYFTWICKIALNKMADYYRQQVHQKSKFIAPSIDQLNTIIDTKISPEESLVLDELKTQINNCLDLLPEEYRRLLHFKYYQELSNREICLKLNIAPRSLEGKLYRAKKSLAAIIKNTNTFK